MADPDSIAARKEGGEGGGGGGGRVGGVNQEYVKGDLDGTISPTIIACDTLTP